MFDWGRIIIFTRMWYHDRGAVDDLLNELCILSQAENKIKNHFKPCIRGSENLAMTASDIGTTLNLDISNIQIGKRMSKLEFQQWRTKNGILALKESE